MPRKSKKVSKGKKWQSKEKSQTMLAASHSTKHHELLLLEELVYQPEDPETVMAGNSTPNQESVQVLRSEEDNLIETIPECTLNRENGVVKEVPECTLDNEGSVEDVPLFTANTDTEHTPDNKEAVEDAPKSTPMVLPDVKMESFSSHSDFSDYSDCENDDYSLCLETGRGVCIVSLSGKHESGQQFQLNRAALEAVLGRPGVAERPVVVISVAGAFRGGKSFLLDFFLRYLYAQAGAESAEGAADWLGGEREPLRGFDWRGGTQRDTVGIVLWSQPIPVTLPTGEQVVVLLLDTQGAFDAHSSLRDCSLVFALSTLLASVQLYNVSQRIDENVLQHLQLFTEYASLGGSGLQDLQLLVRDWSTPYEYEFGAAGGDCYLRDMLQVTEEQPKEVREIRQRVASSFERVGCFLMPHPGLRAATDQHFCGELAELTDEFKESLRSLAPLLLAPARLRVKRVEGQPLRARDVPVFLQTYLDEFTLRVPSPQTILSATAKARWLSAAAAARAALCAPLPPRALPRAAMLARRDDTLRAALEPLAPLAARALDEAGLARLQQEFEDLLEHRIETNERMIELAVAKAKEVFENALRALDDEQLCLHPDDLTAHVEGARDAAVERLNGDFESDGEDPERSQLVMELEERCKSFLRRLRVVNENNNSRAVSAAHAALAGALAPRPCAHAADLAAAHAAARAAALQAFWGRRRSPARHQHDQYLALLEQKINFFLCDHKRQNDNNNKCAVTEAFNIYERCFSFDRGCWHPDQLAPKDEEARNLALEHLCTSRDGPNRRESDVYSKQLESGLSDRYTAICAKNDRKNEEAIETSFKVFCETINQFCGFFKTDVSILEEKLCDAFRAGENIFFKKRVQGFQEEDRSTPDSYLYKLQRRMRNKRDEYRMKNVEKITGAELAGAVGSTLLAVGGTVAAVGAGQGRRLAGAAATVAATVAYNALSSQRR